MDPQDASTTSATSTFRVEAIPPGHLNEIRANGRDAFGNPLVQTTDAAGGSPLRCCLRPTRAGERIAVIAYQPFARPGPFAESGPVFIHAESCAGDAAPDQYPAAYRDWPAMIFRPYRTDGVIAYEAIQKGDGRTAEELIASMFAVPDIEFIHTRNVYAGCYMFTITRPPAPSA